MTGVIQKIIHSSDPSDDVVEELLRVDDPTDPQALGVALAVSLDPENYSPNSSIVCNVDMGKFGVGLITIWRGEWNDGDPIIVMQQSGQSPVVVSISDPNAASVMSQYAAPFPDGTAPIYPANR